MTNRIVRTKQLLVLRTMFTRAQKSKTGPKRRPVYVLPVLGLLFFRPFLTVFEVGTGTTNGM